MEVVASKTAGVETAVNGDGGNGCSAWQRLAAFLDEKEGRVRGRG
jgi:hypothetical protein